MTRHASCRGFRSRTSSGRHRVVGTTNRVHPWSAGLDRRGIQASAGAATIALQIRASGRDLVDPTLNVRAGPRASPLCVDVVVGCLAGRMDDSGARAPLAPLPTSQHVLVETGVLAKCSSGAMRPEGVGTDAHRRAPGSRARILRDGITHPDEARRSSVRPLGGAATRRRVDSRTAGVPGGAVCVSQPRYVRDRQRRSRDRRRAGTPRSARARRKRSRWRDDRQSVGPATLCYGSYSTSTASRAQAQHRGRRLPLTRARRRGELVISSRNECRERWSAAQRPSPSPYIRARQSAALPVVARRIRSGDGAPASAASKADPAASASELARER